MEGKNRRVPAYENAGTYGTRVSARRLTNQPTKEEPMGEVYLSLSMSLDRFVAVPGDDVVEAPEGETRLRFRTRR